MKHCILSILIFVVCSVLSAANPMLYECTGFSVKLRWKGNTAFAQNGYHIYRRLQSETQWKEVGNRPIMPVFGNKELKQLLGFKTAAYLQLFGLNENENLTQKRWDSTFANASAAMWIGALSLAEPGYAIALGETWEDKTVEAGLEYAYKIVQEQNGTPVDIGIAEHIKPSVPELIPMVEELTAFAGFGDVTLKWNRHTAEMKTGAVCSYHVYMATAPDGPFERVNFYGSLSIRQTGMADDATESYRVQFLDSGIRYYFKVRPANAFGTECRQATVVSAVPKGRNSQVNRASFTGFRAVPTGKGILLTWNKNIQVKICRGNSAKGLVPVSPTAAIDLPARSRYFDANVQSGKTYYYCLLALEEGKTTISSDTISVFLQDNTPPSAPEGIMAIAIPGYIAISWKAVEGATGYEIERASDAGAKSRFLINRKPITQTRYTDTLKPGVETRFGYLVYALDQNGLRSKPGKMVFAQMPDKTPPSKPVIVAAFSTDTGVRLSWLPAPEADFGNWLLQHRTNPGQPWSTDATLRQTYWNGRMAAGRYQFRLLAKDSSGNVSPESNLVWVTVADKQVVKAPDSVSIVLEQGTVVLHWKPSGPTRPKAWYVTRIAGGKTMDMGTVASDSVSFSDPYPAIGVNRYEIRAVNDAWEMGVPLVLRIEYKP